MAQVQPPSDQYAALGDSYSSGEGVGLTSYYSGTTLLNGNWNRCHRSIRSWPARVADRLFGMGPVEAPAIYKRQNRFIFRACSGAVTTNIWNTAVPPAAAIIGGQYNEWSEFEPGVVNTNEWIRTPAQSWWLQTPANAANPNITLVTFTIGGNDVGFGTIGRACVEGLIGYNEANCLATIAAMEGNFPAFQAKLEDVLSRVRVLAPNAQIRVPMYPQILNYELRRDILVGVFRDQWARNFALFRVQARVANELGWFTWRLDDRIAKTVANWRGARNLPANLVSTINTTYNAFDGHRLGDPEPWVNGLVAPILRESFHPTCQGNIAIATRVLANRGLGPLAWAC
jgi:hypothetical protein